jgi:hypothetical protein
MTDSTKLSDYPKTETVAKRQEWTTAELQVEFSVVGFSMGMVVVDRKSDGVRGSMMFDHSPRIYYGFVPA